MELLHRSQSSIAHLLGQYLELTKPRIVMLTAFCAVIGMVLASTQAVPWQADGSESTCGARARPRARPSTQADAGVYS